MVLDVEFADTCHEAFAIGLTLVADKMGMCCAEQDVDSVGTALQDRRHGVDHDLNPLARCPKPTEV